jgi:hypothetical protein
MEDFPLASRALARARALDPGSLPILTDVGFQLHYNNRNTDAEEVLKHVFLRDPNFPLAHFWMGRVMHTMEHCTEGLAELEAVAASLRDWQPYIRLPTRETGKYVQVCPVVRTAPTAEPNRSVISVTG